MVHPPGTLASVHTFTGTFPVTESARLSLHFFLLAEAATSGNVQLPWGLSPLMGIFQIFAFYILIVS